MIRFLLSFSIILAGCAHVPAASEDDYYRMIETRVGTQGKGEAEREVREIYCPENSLQNQDPQFWSIDELKTKLDQKQCLQITCRYRGGLVSKCVNRGNSALMADLEKQRSRVVQK